MKAEEMNIQFEIEELSNDMMNQLFGGNSFAICGNDELEEDLPALVD